MGRNDISEKIAEARETCIREMLRAVEKDASLKYERMMDHRDKEPVS